MNNDGNLQETAAGPVPRPFRFNVAPKSKVNCFRPKLVDTELMAMRYSQFGGAFSDYHLLPKSTSASVIWELWKFNQNTI